MRHFVVSAEDEGHRLDTVVAELANVSRSRVQQWLRDGIVSINGRPGRPAQIVDAGDQVMVLATQAPALQHPASNALRLPIIYEDVDMLVIDKPAGLAVHPTSPNDRRTTVVDFARAHTSDPDTLRPGIVHRLDQDTSGLLILAKHPAAKAYLQYQFAQRRIAKRYLALVVGRPSPEAAVIRLPLARSHSDPTKSEVLANGRAAETTYETVAVYPGYSLVEARPQTGRTHQLRVHFAALGHPIAGDTRYGRPRLPLGLSRQFLHAAGLELTSPGGQQLKLESSLPQELAKFIAELAAKAEGARS